VALAWYGSYWFLTLVSPMIMLYLLWYVTGIPPTEARSLQTRGDAYREYQRTTSPFFPWFPKQ
jgi:steroid 5-alpha reductase family enzyme